MNEYHKIQTVYLRDPANNHKTLLVGQYAWPEFEYLTELKWTFTEKVDGTNIRVVWDGSNVWFKGRTDKADIPPFLFAKLEQLFSIEAMQEYFTDDPVTLYGEGYGARIQKGGGNYIPDGVGFVLFDVWAGMWLQRESVEDVARQLRLPIVPIIGSGTLRDAVDLAANGFGSQWGNFQAEGIVMRPATELMTRRGSRIISKVKCKDFA